MVTKADANEVVKLYQESLFEACYMEPGGSASNSYGNRNYQSPQKNTFGAPNSRSNGQYGSSLPKGVDMNNVGN